MKIKNNSNYNIDVRGLCISPNGTADFSQEDGQSLMDAYPWCVEDISVKVPKVAPKKVTKKK